MDKEALNAKADSQLKLVDKILALVSTATALTTIEAIGALSVAKAQLEIVLYQARVRATMQAKANAVTEAKLKVEQQPTIVKPDEPFTAPPAT